MEALLRNRGALQAIRRFDPEIVFHLAGYHPAVQRIRPVSKHAPIANHHRLVSTQVARGNPGISAS
jgi:hypothetical protein